MEKDYLISLLSKGKRPDERNALDYRQIKIEYGATKTAEGSARVMIGDTHVIVGVKVEIGKPYPDSPDQGTIMVGAELIPLSNPDFEPGPPTIQAIEIARVVDRGIRESKAIDFRKLCIREGEKAWIIMIDIVTINDAGNLIDASALAALAALKDMRFPSLDGEKINYKEKTDEGLSLEQMPIAVTVYKVGDHFIVDPEREEEAAADARLTVSVMENGELCALQKGGNEPLTQDDIGNMIDIAIEKSAVLREELENAKAD